MAVQEAAAAAASCLPLSERGIRAKKHRRQKQIDRGEYVPNAPLRTRCEHLLATDPEFGLSELCRRMADLGYPSFLKKKRNGAESADTSHLSRLLGMRDQAPTHHHGRRYTPGGRTTHVPYPMAVAIARGLGMDGPEIDEIYAAPPEDVDPSARCESCDVQLLKPDPVGLCGFCIEELALA